MDSVDFGLNILTVLILSLFITGIYRPHIVLWWEDRQNRLKVIKVYGSALTLMLALKLLLPIWF